MVGSLSSNEEAQLQQTIEMFEVITQSQPQDYQSLEILKEAYFKVGREREVINTSKRIAQAYVMMGQLSSAILEYESILQRHPDDPDVLAALGELESKANSLNSQPATVEMPAEGTKIQSRPRARSADSKAAAEVDDGRQMLYKIFVESKVIAQGDFELCWVKQDLSAPPGKIIEPFIQNLADKSILPLEKSLKIISDKHRIAYLPFDKYDIDVELARGFPAQTLQRWCVLPFDRMSKSVLVATANPFNKQAALELEQATKQRFLWYLVNPPDLIKALRKIIR
jgi:tetratricopeptide (TPR) repeat protein